jgi:hypothetical protein
MADAPDEAPPPPPAQTVPESDYDTWVVCRHRFSERGCSAVITVNTSLEQRAIFAKYPYHVSVAIEAAPQSIDAAGRIGAHESQHLLNLSRVIREALECEEQHIIAIVHGAGARTLESYARDGSAVAARLRELKEQKNWDRSWRFEIKRDPEGKLSERWRDIARASEEHHLAINVPHSGASDHHHFLF